MGVRGELFSTKVSLQNRTYFFNVKENRLGDLYLNMVESKNRDEGGFERQSIVLFAEDLQEFLQGFDESLKVLEKSAREKRKGPPRRDGTSQRDGSFNRDGAASTHRDGPPHRDGSSHRDGSFRRDGPPRRSDDRPRPPRRESGDFDGRKERRFDEPRFGSRPPRRDGAPDRGERRFGGESRFHGGDSRGGDRPGAGFRGGRGDRDERPRRPRFGDRQEGRRDEGRRNREDRKDKPPFPSKKRMVVKKR